MYGKLNSSYQTYQNHNVVYRVNISIKRSLEFLNNILSEKTDSPTLLISFKVPQWK